MYLVSCRFPPNGCQIVCSNAFFRPGQWITNISRKFSFQWTINPASYSSLSNRKDANLRLKDTQVRLAAGLFPDPLVELMCSPNKTLLLLKWLLAVGVGPSERNPVRTKAQQNEIPIERNPIRTKIRQKESPTERKAQFEPVYNRLCVETVFAASVNVTTET